MDKSTATLLFYLVVMTPSILLGFYFARTKRFRPYHRGIMTAVTLLNWVLIVIVMIGSYSGSISYGTSAEATGDIPFRYAILPTLHLITGGIAQLLATYLVALMWTEDLKMERLLPFRIRNIKTPMRLTMGLWLVTILLGVGIYAVWRAPATAQAAELPAATEEATSEAVVATEAPALATQEAAPVTTEEAPASTEAPSG
jgi:uncharacterized membrane protein YozB (DUF420 family)